jgi:hypothetical protein
MAPPFPLFIKRFMKIFSPNPRAFPYGSYFIPRAKYLEVRISKKSHAPLKIEPEGGIRILHAFTKD